MLIKVTAKHLAEGKRKNCEHCPIALAIKDVIIPGVEVTVVFAGVYFDMNTSWFFEPRPLGLVRERIQAFDRGGYVEPFDFEISIPEELCVSS